MKQRLHDFHFDEPQRTLGELIFSERYRKMNSPLEYECVARVVEKERKCCKDFPPSTITVRLLSSYTIRLLSSPNIKDHCNEGKGNVLVSFLDKRTISRGGGGVCWATSRFYGIHMGTPIYSQALWCISEAWRAATIMHMIIRMRWRVSLYIRVCVLYACYELGHHSLAACRTALSPSPRVALLFQRTICYTCISLRGW